jgi:hypothetical protein
MIPVPILLTVPLLLNLSVDQNLQEGLVRADSEAQPSGCHSVGLVGSRTLHFLVAGGTVGEKPSVLTEL